ncbi:hypothetical protein ABZ468_43395 [Streptomyces sp. NPDC005708]|uniref:hypothetical protein n=1 Tax=Streptomyces sp. NPDC005708 TaxID=3154564 RepID=UPI0033C6D991
MSGLFDLQTERHRIVEDAHRTQLNAGLGLTHNHGPPVVQVDTDILMSVVLAHLRASFAVTQ